MTNLNSFLNLLINFISTRSAPQILSMKAECTFLFVNFLIIDLCDSSVNSLLDIILFLTVLPKLFLSKISKPLKQVHVDIHHIWDF